MLVLSRKENERIIVGEDIVITLVEIRGDKCRIGIDAPRNVTINREEVHRELKLAQEKEQSNVGS